MSSPSTAKRGLRYLKDWIYVLIGAVIYKLTGENKDFAYQAMIRLYCRTHGQSSDFISRFLQRLHPAETKAPVQGVLGAFSHQDLMVIGDKINRDGYHVFEKKLSEEFVQDLMRFTQDTKAFLRRGDNDPITQETRKDFYKRGAPQAVRYDYSPEDLMRNPVVQKLVADPSVLAVARAYLGVEPVIDIVTMWWHTDFSKTPDSNAAQLYHFDMERVKWLKFFFYITDVTTDTGPHCFVKGTHRAEKIPSDLLDRGYVRITDDDMKKHFRPEDFIEFEGTRGTIIAEDTIGLHKGKHVHKGDRLIFQLEFAVSMFGSPGCEKFKITDVRLPELDQALTAHPRVYKNFSASNHQMGAH